MEEIQPGIFRQGDKLFTEAAVDENVYGEQLRQVDGETFRQWKPSRSKAGAAVMKDVDLGIEHESEILYLGAASGTTVSHFSDIADDGFIVAVEYSETVIQDLVKLAEQRENIAPVLGDARKPEGYSEYIDKVDIVFQDISQRDQASIFLRNVERFLDEDGTALLAVKAQSISSTQNPEEVFEEVKEELSGELEIVEETRLEPYETDHLFLKMKKK
ncbi:MAG: fibrillarin-like rRNA/tRNA 2'-O-methyltransferase [Candidatus Nanohaloarchaea archaeon]